MTTDQPHDEITSVGTPPQVGATMPPMPLTLGILTPPERARICNGCGPSGWKRHTWRWRIAKFLTPDLAEACDRHDLAYWIGGTEADRMVADLRLLADIHTIAQSAPWYVALLLHGEGIVLFELVREFGAAHFHHGEKRTFADLGYLP